MRMLALLGLLAGAASGAAGPAAFSSGPARVALIELYTSEGCSSCPPAEEWLGALRGKPGLWKEFVPVEFHVSYWDSLGWKDRLASRDFTARQYAYASAWGGGNVYTPCFVRNGIEWRPIWGSSGAGGSDPGPLRVEVGEDGTCRIDFLPRATPRAEFASLEIHVAVLGGGLSSRVTAGENSGETLRHEFVVLGLSERPLLPDAAGPVVRASLPLPKAAVPGTGRLALAAWVTRRGELEPLQATGGWLP